MVLALLLSAALPVMRYACDMMAGGAAREVGFAAARHGGRVASAIPSTCQRHDVETHTDRSPSCPDRFQEGERCPGLACTTMEKGEAPALAGRPSPVPAPDRLFAAAFFLSHATHFTDPANAQGPAARRAHDEAPSERVPVRLRTSTYLL